MSTITVFDLSLYLHYNKHTLHDTRKGNRMPTPLISNAIKDLYHIRKRDLDALTKELRPTASVTAHDLKHNFSWDIDDAFEKHGIDTLFDLSLFLRGGGSIKSLKEVTKGSTSQYEANYKLNQYFLENSDPEPNNFIIPGEPHLSDEDETTLHIESTGETISIDTVLHIMNPYAFSPLKTEAFTRHTWGTFAADELITDYHGSVLEALMSTIPGNNTTGIITIIEPNGTFHGDMFFEINYEEDIVVYSNGVIPAILQSTEVLKDYIVSLEVFNDDEDIEVIAPGGKKEIVPRKYLATWVCDEGLHYHGLDEEEASTLRSIDFETQELLVPEEGVDFLDVPCIEFE